VLLALGVSDAKLEEGSMRFDVNVSIRPVGMPSTAPRSS
jgi:Asp-tRNA(Asn)/Glu-tRNA(Gln) amidotransferase B subunit